MSVQQVHDFFAVLTIVAAAGAVLMVLSRVINTVPTVRFLDTIYKVQLPLAALVALVATVGSLYMSEFGNKFAPCRFCWFQRIFMYSLAVVLLVAAIRRDRGVRWYAAALAGIGILLSTWHILLEHGVVTESAECKASIPCAIPYLISFGHRDPDRLGPTGFPAITLAIMAFCGFAAILALLLLPEAPDANDIDIDTPLTTIPTEDAQHGKSTAS
ncbi:MAG: disulfide bond formation protein B [Actinomycetota bacterium]